MDCDLFIFSTVRLLINLRVVFVFRTWQLYTPQFFWVWFIMAWRNLGSIFSNFRSLFKFQVGILTFSYLNSLPHDSSHASFCQIFTLSRSYLSSCLIKSKAGLIILVHHSEVIMCLICCSRGRVTNWAGTPSNLMELHLQRITSMTGSYLCFLLW